MRAISARRLYRWLPMIMLLIVAVTGAVGAFTLGYVKNRLLATTGESLALAAADIADKLDRILYERYGDIQVMAQAPVLRGRDPDAMSMFLRAIKTNKRYFLWLGTTDQNGRVVAATDRGSIGQDWSGRDWFRQVRAQGGVHVRDAEFSKDFGGMGTVSFTAPLHGPRGEFLGVVTSRVGLAVLEDVFLSTVQALQAQRGASSKIEWQFLTRDGELIVDSILRQEGTVNLRQLALPSALFAGSSQPGYVEEIHLRRNVPVVTGYAQSQGYGNFVGLHWGILVRMDRKDILAPIQTVLFKVGTAGALMFIPMFAFLLWATRRLRVEWAQTQEREDWLSTLLKSIGDAVIATDELGRVTFLNPLAQALTGWTQGEAMGKALNEVFDAIDKTTRRPLENPVTRILREGPIQVGTHSLLRVRDGTERAVEHSGAPILNNEGEIVGIVMIFRDITERIRAAEALRQTEEQLRQSQKIEAIGQLAGGVAHDFNNLLTVIKGYSELLLGSRELADSQRKNAEEIKSAADKAAQLTYQLLAFSRKQVLQPRVLDLNVVVTNLESMMRRLIGEDIEIVFVPCPTLGRAKADQGQIEQILINLAVNARDAMPKGGRLTIETANVDLDQAYTQQRMEVLPGRYVMVAVTDNGCGMDTKTQDHIFEPFFTTKEFGRGTGLGLSTVYGIVKQSGGYIWVYSEPGRGSTFKIYLPRIEGEGDAAQPETRIAASYDGTETILLVEDEEVVRNFIRQALRRKGYVVLEARHSREAFLICGQHENRIQLMITDVVMPGMSGRELAERLVSSHPTMKILYISGYTDDAVIRHGIISNEVAFLQKPFTPDNLARKVREVLDGRGRA
ncbi:MAG: response regulator [Nitrospirae bacterium]|nr:MAG: response regulator [Nitrospirota bacterium]